MSIEYKNRSLDVDEFQEFVSTASSLEPPRAVSVQIVGELRRALNPPPAAIFMKLSIIHLLVGTITLLFCPQFGVGIFHNHGLVALFERFGHLGCMILCGALFLGSSMVVAAAVLRPEEIKILRRGTIFHLMLLSTLSIALFSCVNAEITLSRGMVWFLGSVLGGITALEFLWSIRRHIILSK